ncbi:hypothetical protein [Amphibiibacter pelophylacis]|uniref:Uncharacterized protein n=1 Tax=Amphibiibacter pelophylacis TaxID=1799477 RepID=A0ACC6NZ30_9BURK
MHLILPWAWPFDEAPARLPALPATPHLNRLLADWTAGPRLSAPGEDPLRSLNPPHEHALAQAATRKACTSAPPCPDGRVPMAAYWAAQDGLAVTPANAAHWALATPCHWQVGQRSTVLALPAAPAWDETVSRRLFEALAPLFADEASDSPLELLWGQAGRWYVRHPLLAELPLAALDRVLGQDVQAWLPQDADLGDDARALLRRLRRLQAEAQMLLYTHPAHDALERAGSPPVNTLWFSGSGDGTLWTQGTGAPADPPRLDDVLARAALAGDIAAWAQAWSAVEARVASGGLTALTLCSQRAWRTWRPTPPAAAWNVLARWQQQRRIARSSQPGALAAVLTRLDDVA